ncbi:MAG: glycosyltransferase [Verrucomicrobia bacterium]|nr:glycosyltransferase [Verrucomicrobiota bacterium]
MRIGYFIPPAPLRAGGLDLAIAGLARELPLAGLEIVVEPATLDGLDAVHLHGLWQPRFIRLARECRRRGLRYVVSPHGMLEPWAWRHRWWKKWPYFYLRERSVLNRAGALLATSRIEASNLRRFRFSPSIVTLPLGLTCSKQVSYKEARAGLGWAAHEFVLLYLSRLHPKKGMHLLLAALTSLNLDPDAYRLVVVGDGPEAYTRRLKRIAKANQAQLPRIDWLPAVWDDRKWSYLQGADLFCLPTYSENFGLAILEACQAGTPVLTTRETPWVEFLGRHGLPVAGPDAESIRGCLTRILQAGKMHPVQRANLASATRREFGWEHLRPGYRSLYEAASEFGVPGTFRGPNVNRENFNH